MKGTKFASSLDTKNNIEKIVYKKQAGRFKTIDILPPVF